MPQIEHDPSPTHGPYITITVVGAFRLHAETGRWSLLLHFAAPPGPVGGGTATLWMLA